MQTGTFADSDGEKAAAPKILCDFTQVENTRSLGKQILQFVSQISEAECFNRAMNECNNFGLSNCIRAGVEVRMVSFASADNGFGRDADHPATGKMSAEAPEWQCNVSGERIKELSEFEIWKLKCSKLDKCEQDFLNDSTKTCEDLKKLQMIKASQHCGDAQFARTLKEIEVLDQKTWVCVLHTGTSGISGIGKDMNQEVAKALAFQDCEEKAKRQKICFICEEAARNYSMFDQVLPDHKVGRGYVCTQEINTK